MNKMASKILNKIGLKLCSLAVCSMILVPSIECLAYGEARVSDISVSSDSVSENTNTVIEINNASDFIQFASQCSTDGWSKDKTVKLMADITISDASFQGVPYFNGLFEGNGYTVKLNYMMPAGSEYGFFRYIGPSGTVNDLTVVAVIEAQGSKNSIGGICGVNYGVIYGCSFNGQVIGQENIGGIAGENKEGASIIGCINNASISATNRSGGIAGYNSGNIVGCSNTGNVNTEEIEAALNVDSAIDVNSFNLTKNVIDRNDMGGIAGFSSGVISNCINSGDIGYNHTGYNVGGIAGRQNGIIMSCVNYGIVSGRKDVGGIVGQAEPYIESEYLSEKITTTEENINQLNNTISSILSTAQKTSEEAGVYADNLYNQYLDDKESVSNDIAKISDSVSDNNAERQQYIKNIEEAQENIDELTKEAEDLKNHPEKLLDENYNGKTYIEILEEIQDNYDVINDNLSKLQDTYSYDYEGDTLNNISDRLKENSSDKDLENMIVTIDSGYDELCTLIGIAAGQMEDINADTQQTINQMISGNYIEDISDISNEDEFNGAVIYCSNRGTIYGDINAAGITGNMNIEYDEDPEYDFDVTDETDIVVRSTVNCLVMHCKNYGVIFAKKDNAGSVVGQQEFGIVYDCEGYGRVSSDSGKYIGGIVGYSAGLIKQSYALCNIEGASFVGGICGYGYSIEDCISLVCITSNGECIGAIAGNVNSEGERKNNYFSSDTLEGIDFISYIGNAEKLEREELMKLEHIPYGFSTVTVYFTADGEEIGTMVVALGSYISMDDFPVAPEKEEYYAVWKADDISEPVYDNRKYEVIYEPWKDSVGSIEQYSNGKTLILVEGQFHKEAKVNITNAVNIYAEGENETLLYSYSYSIVDEDCVSENHIVRMYGGEHPEKVTVYTFENGSWNKQDSYVDGSYIVCMIQENVEFAVVEENENYIVYYIAGGAAGILILIILINILKKNSKDRKKKEINK